MIQFERQALAVSVTAVGHDTNTITLSEPFTWSARDGMSLPFHGTRPDQRMFERWE